MFNDLRLHIIILGFCIGFNSKAQITGVKFAPNHTHWSSSASFRTGSSSVAYVSNNIYINGDTVINSKYCQKVFASTSSAVNSLPSEYFDTTCLQFHGYLYYDNKKLYTDSTFSGNGTLKYDFNLIVGDTFNLLITNLTGGCNGHYGSYKMPIDIVDSMYYGNTWRKRIVFKQVAGFDFGTNPITWVEGIGDIDHGLGINNPYSFGSSGQGLFSIYGFIDYCFCDWGYVRLNCFQETGHAAYGNYCVTNSCSNEIKTSSFNFFDIYPNPASGIINVETRDKIFQVEITDLLGEKTPCACDVLTTKGKLSLDVSSLQNGIYFFHLKASSGTLTKKIIIRH